MHDALHPMMSRRGLRALRNITHESETNFSLATMRLEGEFSRRIGLTPLRALWRRVRFGTHNGPRAHPLLEQLDASLLEHLLAMLPAVRDILALGACCHHFKRCVRDAALAWEAVADIEGVVGLRTPRRWPLSLPSARARRARAALQLSRRWRAGPIAPRGTLRGHKQWVVSLAAADASGWVVSGSDDGSIRLWDSVSGRCRAVVPEAHCMPVVALAAHSPLPTVGGGGDVVTWVASSSGEPMISLWALHSGGTAGGAAAAASTSASLAAAFVSGDRAPTALPAALSLSGSLIAHTDTVWSVTWLPGGLIASASGDRTIRIWDAARVMHEADEKAPAAGRSRATQGHQALVRAMAAEPEGKSWPSIVPRSDEAPGGRGAVVGATGGGGGVRAAFERAAAASRVSVEDEAVSGRGAVVGETGGGVGVRTAFEAPSWAFERVAAAAAVHTAGEGLARLEVHPSSSGGATLRDASTQTDLASEIEGAEVGTARVAPSVCFEPLCVLRGHAQGVVALALLDEVGVGGVGECGGGGGGEGGEGGEGGGGGGGEGGGGGGGEGGAAAAAHMRRGERAYILASGSYDTSIKLWDLGPLLRQLDPALDGGERFRGTSSGSSSRDRSTRPSQVPSELPLPECFATLQGHAAWVSALTPLGDRLASGSYDGTVRLWRLALPHAPRAAQQAMHAPTILRQGQPVTSLCVVGGGLLAAAGYDHCVQIWDPSSATRLRTLRGHEDTVWALASVGSLCISGAGDNTVRLWGPPGNSAAAEEAAEEEEESDEESDVDDERDLSSVYARMHAQRSPTTTGTGGGRRTRGASSIGSSAPPTRLPGALLDEEEDVEEEGEGAARSADTRPSGSKLLLSMLVNLPMLLWSAPLILWCACRRVGPRGMLRALVTLLSWAVCNNPITWALAAPEPRPLAVHITLAMAAMTRGHELGRSPPPDGWPPRTSRREPWPPVVDTNWLDTNWLERVVASLLGEHDVRHRRARKRAAWRLDLARSLLMGRAPAHGHTVTWRE